MASQLKLFLPANYTTHLLSNTRATNEGIAVLEVWSIFPFAIKGIFPCSFENKCIRLLTRVYGICTVLVVPSIAYIAANPAISTFTTNWANGILIFLSYRTFTTLSSLSLAVPYLMCIPSWYPFSLLLFLLWLFLGLTLLFFWFLAFPFASFFLYSSLLLSSFSCRYFIICSPERWEGKSEVPFLVFFWITGLGYVKISFKLWDPGSTPFWVFFLSFSTFFWLVCSLYFVALISLHLMPSLFLLPYYPFAEVLHSFHHLSHCP